MILSNKINNLIVFFTCIVTLDSEYIIYVVLHSVIFLLMLFTLLVYSLFKLSFPIFFSIYDDHVCKQCKVKNRSEMLFLYPTSNQSNFVTNWKVLKFVAECHKKKKEKKKRKEKRDYAFGCCF